MHHPLDAMFWKTVRHWCSAKPTIVVQGDAEINQSSLRGTVEAFIVGKSIVFRCDTGELMSWRPLLHSIWLATRKAPGVW